MERDGKTIFTYTEKGAYLILKDNTDGYSDVAQASFAVTRQGTARDWHQLLAHAADDAIQHLPQATKGVKITNKKKVPSTNKCETCALSKAHQIISRSTFKSEDSDKPFHRVTYDLIPIASAINQHKWVSHIACAKTDFHIVGTHRNKNDAVKFLRYTLKLIQVRYNSKVVFMRSDREPTLGGLFKELLTEYGIS